VKVRVDRRPLVDLAGTGSDGLGTFNFSTAAALVAAASGTAVAKHGNRAVSSRSGSADILEALGVDIEPDLESLRLSIEEDGFGFLLANRHHPAMRHVAPARKALGMRRTVFNLLGPLTNPASARRQVVGVYDRDIMPVYAQAFLLLGAERVMIARGEDGMDEMSLTGETLVCHGSRLRGIWTETVAPEQAGLKRAAMGALLGGDARRNALVLEDIFEGKKGPVLEGILFNAAAALLVAGAAASLKEGAEMARASVASGKARETLERLRKRKKKGTPS